MVWRIADCILPPPGAPTTSCTRPSRSRMVGAMVELRIRHGLEPPAGSESHWLKSMPESFRKKPETEAPDPHTELLVFVSATALPSPSTTERCVVSPPSGVPAGVGAKDGVRDGVIDGVR